MSEVWRLMCILAHPDDETLGHGGRIAKYVTEGVRVCIITAPRGQRSWMGDPQADSINFVKTYEPILGPITMPVDGEVRRAVPFPEWAITTRLDAETHWCTATDAAYRHRTQMGIFPPADQIPEDVYKQLSGHPTLYHAYSLVNGGRRVERDIPEGQK